MEEWVVRPPTSTTRTGNVDDLDSEKTLGTSSAHSPVFTGCWGGRVQLHICAGRLNSLDFLNPKLGTLQGSVRPHGGAWTTLFSWGHGGCPYLSILPFLQDAPSLVPSLIASASAVTGGSGGDIPDAAYLLLQCHLPVCGDRKPGAVSEQHLPQYAGLH